MDMLKLVTHIGLFLVSGFTAGYDFFMNEPGSSGPWGRFKYFTYWNICFQALYFGINVATDLTEKKSNPSMKSQRSAMQIWRDVFHACIAFPSAMFVTVYFWILYKVDRELVWPEELDKLVPNWLNHLLHTTVFLFIVIDKLIVRHHYPSRIAGMFGAVMVATTYYLCVLYLFYTRGIWVYPMLEILQGRQWLLFVASNFVSSVVLYSFGQWLTSYLWGPGPKTAAAIQKQKDKRM